MGDLNIVSETAGIWKSLGSSTKYVDELRKSWKKRSAKTDNVKKQNQEK